MNLMDPLMKGLSTKVILEYLRRIYQNPMVDWWIPIRGQMNSYNYTWFFLLFVPLSYMLLWIHSQSWRAMVMHLIDLSNLIKIDLFWNLSVHNRSSATLMHNRSNKMVMVMKDNSWSKKSQFITILVVLLKCTRWILLILVKFDLLYSLSNP